MEIPNKTICYKNELYEPVENELFKGYRKLEVEEDAPSIIWKGPLIPFDLWRELIAWCETTQEKFKSEALVFLYLDDKTWKIWYPPQITNGMTVKANPDHKDYRKQRKLLGDALQMGTLHHHCTTSAFQSGTDSNDEIDRDGLHFTIGNLDKDVYDIHLRLCFGGSCYKAKPESFIELDPDLAKVPAKYRMSIHAQMLAEPTDKSQWTYDFSKELKNIEKPFYSPSLKKYGNFGGHQDSFWAEGTHVPRSKGTKHSPVEILPTEEYDTFIDMGYGFAHLFNDFDYKGISDQAEGLIYGLSQMVASPEQETENFIDLLGELPVRKAKQLSASLIEEEDFSFPITELIPTMRAWLQMTEASR